MANKIELAKAYVQVIPTTDDLGSSLKDALVGPATDAGEEAGDAAGQGVTSGIGKLVKSAALIGAVVAVGKKVADTIKESINQYADFEQLVGGVETLFKDSADVVQQYAQNAYKTAGLSANDYMETVTSFSASLIQSLDGDTAKAAEVANQAITDMSDNANKMGTSMESIQAAYQGFAKQNYTMLDNLKLGYGGTKTEMERLLKDAEAISGIHYDINNYADVVEAIHQIQNNMDITGTTAKEAGATISGSMDSMKASWANLLTTMSDPNGDMTSAISNFSESVKTFASNMMPTLIQAIKGSGDLISGLVDMVIEMLPDFCKEVLPDLVSTAIDLAVDVVTGLIEAIPQLIDILVNDILSAENISKLVAGAIELVVSLVTHLPEIIVALIEAIPTIISNVITALIDNLPLLIEGCVEMVVQLVTHIPEIIGAFITAVPKIIDSIVNALTNSENLQKFIDVGKKAIDKIKEGFAALKDKCKEKFEEAKEAWSKTWDNIKEKCGPIVNKIKEGFGKLKDKMKSIGTDVVKGLWNGINSKVQWIKDKITGWCGKVGGAIKDFFGIASPSKLMAEYGRYIDEGLANGIENNSKIAANAMKELGEDALGGINVNGVVQSNVMAASATPSIASDRKLDQIEALLKKIAEGQNLYIDGNKLVGTTANRMNAALDKISYSRERGVTNYAY